MASPVKERRPRPARSRWRSWSASELTLAYEELAITAEPGLILMIYTAEPGSPSAERLALLASWATASPPASAGIDTAPPGRFGS